MNHISPSTEDHWQGIHSRLMIQKTEKFMPGTCWQISVPNLWISHKTHAVHICCVTTSVCICISVLFRLLHDYSGQVLISTDKM